MSATDVILIVNHINSQPKSNPEGEATDALFAEGEFSSASDLNDNLLSLLVADSLNSKKKS